MEYEIAPKTHIVNVAEYMRTHLREGITVLGIVTLAACGTSSEQEPVSTPLNPTATTSESGSPTSIPTSYPSYPAGNQSPRFETSPTSIPKISETAPTSPKPSATRSATPSRTSEATKSPEGLREGIPYVIEAKPMSVGPAKTRFDNLPVGNAIYTKYAHPYKEGEAPEAVLKWYFDTYYSWQNYGTGYTIDMATNMVDGVYQSGISYRDKHVEADPYFSRALMGPADNLSQDLYTFNDRAKQSHFTVLTWGAKQSNYSEAFAESIKDIPSGANAYALGAKITVSNILANTDRSGRKVINVVVQETQTDNRDKNALGEVIPDKLPSASNMVLAFMVDDTGHWIRVK